MNSGRIGLRQERSDAQLPEVKCYAYWCLFFGITQDISLCYILKIYLHIEPSITFRNHLQSALLSETPALRFLQVQGHFGPPSRFYMRLSCIQAVLKSSTEWFLFFKCNTLLPLRLLRICKTGWHVPYFEGIYRRRAIQRNRKPYRKAFHDYIFQIDQLKQKTRPESAGNLYIVILSLKRPAENLPAYHGKANFFRMEIRIVFRSAL